MLRAAALGFWSEGASHIYLFNYDAHASSIRRGSPDAGPEPEPQRDSF